MQSDTVADVKYGFVTDAFRAELPPKSGRRPVNTARWPYVPHTVGFVGISAAMVSILVAAGAPTPLLPIYEREWGFPSWKLTLAFGVYAIALLVAILVIGSLSDHIGRRRLMIAALALNLVAMLMFLFASSIDGLIAARIVQGVATGAASSALSAAVVELAPERHKKLGALMAGMAPLAGLGIGALFAGILAQIVSDAAFTVWLVLVVLMAVATVFTVFTPETGSRKAGALASLIPRVSVPSQVRGLFASTLPGTISAFMTMALFLGLVPIVLRAAFDVESPVIAALAAFVTFGVGTVVSAVTTGVQPHRLRLFGASAMTIGAILFIGCVGAEALPLLWAAAVFCGAGLGASFAGTTRGLVPQVQAHERAGLFAAIFLVAYLAMGISSIVAGMSVGSVGVAAMAVDFGIAIAVVAVVGVVVTGTYGARRGKVHAA
ncbi:MFS transporter [Plantactinospora soyae]|uniref:MFS family permease n=1 Tax=Plantactinospora soyae TaxID=1544732 RepID=A0A927M740_9ACTN|nr:MFS transporter [Plantactinospora soyae]MBE1489217.1 MFS family permease [Plantactinospora soyae]